MVPVVLTSEIRNTSYNAALTSEDRNFGVICTPSNGLDSRLDLVDSFARMDTWIGNTESWIYWVLFYVILFSIGVGISRQRYYAVLRQAAYSLPTFVYSLTLYIIWSIFSFIYGILINIVASSYSDRGLAYDIMINTASFVNLLVAFFTSLNAKIYFTLQHTFLCTFSSEDQLLSHAGDNVYPSDLEEQQKTEIEHLHMPRATSVDVEMSQSTITGRLYDVSQSIDSDQFLNVANYSSSDICSVEVIGAHAPVDRDYLIGDIEVGMFDERGGVFHSYKHGVTVIFPVGAIPSGTLAELKFAATLISPVPFQSNTIPLSAIFWLCMDSKVRLQKPIQLRLPFLQSENIAGDLQFAKSSHLTETWQMKGLEGGIFTDGESYGSIEVNHFCYYCITKNDLKQKDIPSNKYSLILMKQRQPRSRDNSWGIDICLVSHLRTCEEYLKEQYNCDWEYKKLTKFSFVDGCDELKVELLNTDFGNAAKTIMSNVKIKQEDVDFHQYYSNGKLEELKNRMDRKEYPPRFKATVIAKHKSFFAKAHRKIIIQSTCNAKFSYKGKISIPCTSSEGDSSESDMESLQKTSFATSGYVSDDVDAFDDEEPLLGGLQLRNLMVLTSSVNENWYSLGIALNISVNKMENIYGKYSGNPMKALNRVYCYWLSDKNGLSPTWKKLYSALLAIKEFSIATDVKQYLKLSADEQIDDAIFIDDPNDLALKNKVMKYIRLELLDIDALLPLLNKYQLLTQANMYDLKNRLIAPTERANLLVYHILPSKGPGAFTLFVKCLQEEKEHKGHQTLARLFTIPSESENASHQNPSPPQFTLAPSPLLDVSELSVSTEKQNDYIVADKKTNLISFNKASVEGLDLSYCRLNTAGVITALQNTTSMKFLRMNNNEMRDEVASVLSTILLKNLSITEFNISHNKLTLSGIIGIINAVSKNNTIKVLDISYNRIAPNDTDDLAVALSACTRLKILNVSHNLLTFNCVLKIAQKLRDHVNLQTLILSNNFKSFISEAEVLVDIIFSTNNSLTHLDIGGRNIRPRFTGDYSFPPPNCEENSRRFLLHNLYLSEFVSMTDLIFENTSIVTPPYFIKATEECPIPDADIISYYVNHNGGTFYNQDHDFAIVVPPGAVLQSDGTVEIQATASYKCFKRYQFPDGYPPVSSIFWFSANYTFKIPVYLIMGHYASNVSLKDLHFMQACVRDLTISKDGKLVMKEVIDGVYIDKKIGCCLFMTDHFCSVCLRKNNTKLPDHYSALFYTYDDGDTFTADLCFIPLNSNCRKEVEKQYQGKKLDFSIGFEFCKGESLYIPTDFSKIEGWCVRLAGKTEISYDEFEYWRYPELEVSEQNQEYPPRFRIKCIKTSAHLNLLGNFVVQKKKKKKVISTIGQFPFTKVLKDSGVQRNGTIPQHPMHISEFCGNPEDRTFPTISKWIYADWKHIGLLLEVKQFTLDCIDLNYQRVEDKALHMLIKWKSSNPHACYCHLLSALREQDLPKAVEDFKGLLRTCVYKKVHHYYETAV